MTERKENKLGDKEFVFVNICLRKQKKDLLSFVATLIAKEKCLFMLGSKIFKFSNSNSYPSLFLWLIFTNLRILQDKTHGTISDKLDNCLLPAPELKE